MEKTREIDFRSLASCLGENGSRKMSVSDRVDQKLRFDQELKTSRIA